MTFDLEERVERAKTLFSEGYNCCQAVFLAYSDLFEIEKGLAEALSCGFGGGMGRMREVCGSVSGMVLLCGLISGAGPTDREAKTRNYTLVREVAEEFRAKNGSIICRELLGLVPPGSGAKGPEEAATPSARTGEYYQKRPCRELVGLSARIIGKRIALFLDKVNLRD